MKKILLFIIIFSIIFIAGSLIAEAQLVEIPDPLGDKTITEIINLIIDKILAPIGFALATIMIVWSGILYMTAGGSEEKVTKARKALMWAVIGFAIFISAKFIVKLIEEALKSAGA